MTEKILKTMSNPKHKKNQYSSVSRLLRRLTWVKVFMIIPQFRILKLIFKKLSLEILN